MGKKGCEDLHRPLAIYWQGFESTPVTPASTWGTTLLKAVYLLHANGDAWDLECPIITEGNLFMSIRRTDGSEWQPPYDEKDGDTNMVQELPNSPAYALDEAMSDSGMSRSSWRSVITNVSHMSWGSWKPSGYSRQAKLKYIAEAASDLPVPTGPMSSLGPATLYVQRDSCPPEALSMAAELSSKADLPIVFGSVDMANQIEPTETDETDMAVPNRATLDRYAPARMPGSKGTHHAT